MGPRGKYKNQVCQSLSQEMTYGHWEKEGPFSSGLVKLLVTISSLGFTEKGYMYQKKKGQRILETELRYEDAG